MGLALKFSPRLFRLFPFPLSLLRLCLKDLSRDQLGGVQYTVDAFINKMIYRFCLGEAHFHLCRMHVDVRLPGRKGQVQDGKGKSVLHEIRPVTGFKRS